MLIGSCEASKAAVLCACCQVLAVAVCLPAVCERCCGGLVAWVEPGSLACRSLMLLCGRSSH